MLQRQASNYKAAIEMLTCVCFIHLCPQQALVVLGGQGFSYSSPLIIKYNPQVLSLSFTVVLDRWGVRDGQGETDWYSRLTPPIHSKTKWIHLKASLKVQKKTHCKRLLYLHTIIFLKDKSISLQKSTTKKVFVFFIFLHTSSSSFIISSTQAFSVLAGCVYQSFWT